MTHRELLEHALLDALSLLDEEEREEFDLALAAAPPHVQAQIRREQTRLVKMESLLPDVSPPASLRARVLEAVRAAIASERVASERHSGLILHEPDVIARLPAVAHGRRVAAVWRGVALACAAASIVLGVVTMNLQGLVGDFNAQQDLLLEEMKEKFGPEYLLDALVDDATKRITLASTAGSAGSNAQAAIWYNPDWRTAKLFGINLPVAKDNHYKLVVVDDAGQTVSVIAEFTFRGNGLLNEEVPVTVGLSGDRLAILGDEAEGSGRMILSAPELLRTH